MTDSPRSSSGAADTTYVNKPGRARRESDVSRSHRHPDADLPTRRIPFAQLRALVLSLIEPPDGSEDVVKEFDLQPTTYRAARGSLPAPEFPSEPRVGTLDALVAELKRAHAERTAPPPHAAQGSRADAILPSPPQRMDAGAPDPLTLLPRSTQASLPYHGEPGSQESPLGAPPPPRSQASRADVLPAPPRSQASRADLLPAPPRSQASRADLLPAPPRRQPVGRAEEFPVVAPPRRVPTSTADQLPGPAPRRSASISAPASRRAPTSRTAASPTTPASRRAPTGRTGASAASRRAQTAPATPASRAQTIRADHSISEVNRDRPASSRR